MDANGNELDYLHSNLPNATSWSPFSFKFKTHPDAVKIQLLVRLHGKAGQAVLYDSVRLKLDSTVEAESYSYTGKNRDKATQLVYFGARYYDPEIGRFITEDPAKQGHNWYAFCGNNPLKYTDPDGRWFGFDDTLTGPVDEIIVLGGLSIAAAFGSTWAIQKRDELANFIIDTIDKIGNMIVNAKSGDPVGNLWRDKLANPQDWELTKENCFPGKRKGTTSYEREYTNKKTGEKIYEHEIKDDATGKTTHGPHPREYEPLTNSSVRIEVGETKILRGGI